MTYTFQPKEKYARSYGNNLRISTKSAVKICRVIRKKPLTRVKRLLNDLSDKKRSLKGKYYSNTVKEINKMVESCEKNADFLGLDKERLLVHASAHTGTVIRRRRRKSGFGSRMKSTNLEIFLVEKGKMVDKVDIHKKKEVSKEAIKMKSDISKMKKKAEEMKEQQKERGDTQ